MNNKRFPLALAIKIHFSLEKFLAPLPSHLPSWGGGVWSGAVNHEMGAPPPPKSVWLPALHPLRVVSVAGGQRVLSSIANTDS